MVAVDPKSMARNHHAASAANPASAPVAAKPTNAPGAVKNEPPKFVDYTIKKGDTLTSIAKAHKTDVKTLAENNPQIKDQDKIYAGSVMKIPAPRTEAPASTEAVACAVDAAPPVRQPAPPEVQKGARRAAAGREEMLQRNIERAAQPTMTTPAATTKPSAVDTPAARANNAAIAASTQRLADMGLVTKDQAAELKNGHWSKKDMEIAQQVARAADVVLDSAIAQHKEIARSEDAKSLPRGSAKRAEQPVIQAFNTKNVANKLTEGLVQQQTIQQSAELREALGGVTPGDVARAGARALRALVNPAGHLVDMAVDAARSKTP